MERIKNTKGFTLIELLVVIGVLGILVLLAMPMFGGYTKDANFAKGIANAKMIEDASQLYYMDNEDWPRLTDEHYTQEQMNEYAERFYDNTGKEIELDPNGKYYDINYDELDSYVKVTDDKRNYILQNPVGKIYYMEDLSDKGLDRVDYEDITDNDEKDNVDLEELKEPIIFEFTGKGEVFQAPAAGKYLLEVWGAKGQDHTSGHQAKGGKGGYAKGETTLNKGEVVYIYNGSEGNNGRAGTSLFNGGGPARYEGKRGGGATHIAKVPGLLSELEDQRDQVLIVAGAGGGATSKRAGGAGGGLVGTGSRPGTQDKGGIAVGIRDGVNTNGTFGQGGGSNPKNANVGSARASGGGAGWYGGGNGISGYSPGSGGSSYIGNVQNGETIAGNQTMPNPTGGEMIGNSGHGKTKITYIGK